MCLMKLEKHLLNDLLALLAVGEQQSAQSVQTPRVPLEELLIRRWTFHDGPIVADQRLPLLSVTNPAPSG